MKLKTILFYSKKFILIFCIYKNLVEQVICCNLTPLQVDLYKLFVKSSNIDKIDEDAGNSKMSTTTLSAITSMKKLCNRKYI